MCRIVAVDMGGTQLRAAAYKQDQFQPLTQKRVETKGSESDTFGRLVELKESVW